MTLKVFISYKSEYRDFARAVKGQLNQWGFDTWLDVDNIQPGDYFRHKIQQGLDSSDVLLMVLTEEAQLSREVMSEVDYFLDVAKKPVVPLRHRECKPLYIFVSIQYIDFVTDQANGFVQLKQRLNELASSGQKVPVAAEDIIVAPQKPVTAVITDFHSETDLDEQVASGDFGGSAGTAESEADEDAQDEPAPEKSTRQESEKKRELLDDGVFGLPPLEPAYSAAPKPQPPPAPSMQPLVPSLPPQRQSDYMPQPAAAKRRSPILLPLAAVASLIIVVGAVMLLSSNAMTINTPQPSQGTSPLVWIGAVVLLGVVGIVGWRRFGQPKTAAGIAPSGVDDAQNRATMLQNVEEFWLKGVLDPALEAGRLDIGLSSAPGAVLRHKDYGDYALPPNANILDVFNDLNRELLILGAPGGGKTVLLLQLAKELIQEARQDATKAIPVVFNLSSWAAERKPLADWLVDELRQKYQVPKKVASAWVEGEKLLLLLDGLDEVAEQYRNPCVDKINSFRQHYRTVDLALCSRNEEYDALTSKLDVHGAIVLEPLRQPIIDAYLNRPELVSLREVMVNDEELREMSQVPFLLNAMAYAYAGASVTSLEIPHPPTPSPQAAEGERSKMRRTHLFDLWVEKRLMMKAIANYTPSKVRKWLEWLAAKMTHFKETTFYIESLQPARFHEVTGKPIQSHFLISGMIYAVIIGIALSLVGLLGYYVSGRLACGFAIGLTSSIASFLSFGPKGGITQSLPTKAKMAIGIWVIAISTFISLASFTVDWIVVSAIGLPIGFIIAWRIWGNVRSENIMRFRDQMTLNTTEIIGWSINKSIVGFLLGLISAVFFGISFGIGMGLIFGLAAGFSTREAEIRTVPNQGFWQSLSNATKVILVCFTLSILAFGLLNQLIVGVLFGVVLSIVLGAVNGGMFVIQHLVLRLLLWQSDDAPWNYARFLDYCASAGLMRKVGGGYIFAHRYLMEYFAEIEVK